MLFSRYTGELNKEMKTESRTMVLFRNLRMTKFAWAFRRLHCPVSKNSLVLEVGSGGNPYWRANVLCDAYRDTDQRHFEKLTCDRPTILAFTENLPFRDDSFDFVIASHVLEHSEDPARFLDEIQRVAKAGYIEVPNAFFERLGTYYCHRLEISERADTLEILKKKAYIQDYELYDLFGRGPGALWAKWVSDNPFHFHVRYYWTRDSGGIKYKILNPEYEFDWEVSELKKTETRQTIRDRIKKWLLVIFRKTLSQTRRNASINLLDYMRCPNCRSCELVQINKTIQCRICKSEYQVQDNVVDCLESRSMR